MIRRKYLSKNIFPITNDCIQFVHMCKCDLRGLPKNSAEVSLCESVYLYIKNTNAYCRRGITLRRAARIVIINRKRAHDALCLAQIRNSLFVHRKTLTIIQTLYNSIQQIYQAHMWVGLKFAIYKIHI